MLLVFCSLSFKAVSRVSCVTSFQLFPSAIESFFLLSGTSFSRWRESFIFRTNFSMAISILLLISFQFHCSVAASMKQIVHFNFREKISLLFSAMNQSDFCLTLTPWHKLNVACNRPENLAREENFTRWMRFPRTNQLLASTKLRGQIFLQLW